MYKGTSQEVPLSRPGELWEWWAGWSDLDGAAKGALEVAER